MTSRRLFAAVGYVADRLWLFGLRQASASMFGGFLLSLIVLTKVWYPFTAVAAVARCVTQRSYGRSSCSANCCKGAASCCRLGRSSA